MLHVRRFGMVVIACSGCKQGLRRCSLMSGAFIGFIGISVRSHACGL